MRTGWSIRHGSKSAVVTLIERNGKDLVIKLGGETVRGTVEELLYAIGDQVAEGAQLLAFNET